MNQRTLFQSVIAELNLFGIENKFHDVSALPGLAVPEWVNGRTLYEIYVRAFSEEGTFDAVTRRLEALKNQGVDFLWLMPVYPLGRENRKGTMGSPYAVRDYFTVNPEFGVPRDFRRLVETAHALGMKIILDLVANHVAPDYAGFRGNRVSVMRDVNGRPTRRVADWSDVVDLDFTRANTRSHIIEVMEHWIGVYDVDGFRCDVAGLVPLDFWVDAARRIRQIKPDVFMLAEWESPQLHKEAFHASYDWSLYELMRRVITGQCSPARLIEWVKLKNATYPSRALSLRFLENHDKVRAVNVFGREAMAAFLVFVFSLDGVPLIYNGQEIGSTCACSLYEKSVINWTEKDQRIFNLISALVEVRKKHPALWGKRINALPSSAEQVLLYMKQVREESILIAVNFSAEMGQVQPENIAGLSHKSLVPLLGLGRPLPGMQPERIVLPPWSGEYFLIEG